MGDRITFDNISQQLCSINRVTLCSFQNEVQNDSPYLVRYGQLESDISNLCKETTDGFHTLQISSPYTRCYTASLSK